MILRNGQNVVWVSPQGGTIERWQIGEKNIFFPQQIIKIGDQLKLRGGLHVCFPIHGSIDEKSVWYGQPQHGFMRDFIFRAITTTETTALFSANYTDLGNHLQDAIKYCFLYSHKISVLEDGIKHTMRIIFQKHQGNQKPLPLSFGLHPYFVLQKNIYPPNNFSLSGINIEPFSCHGSHHIITYHNKNTYSFLLSDHDYITMQLSGAYEGIKARSIIWTDNKEKYFCVEPVVSNPKSIETEKGFLINPGEEINAECIIRHMSI